MSEVIKDGGSAFPVAIAWEADEYGKAANTGYKVTKVDGGMTLRDYFAASAVAGMLSDSEIKASVREFAERAYEVADAMLEARKS